MIARWTTWWIRLFVVSVVGRQFVDWPWGAEWVVGLALLGFAFVRPPWDRDRPPEPVAPPVSGRWVPVNSPGTKVPSHGLRAYGQTYAVDLLRPNPPGTSAKIGWGLGMRRPEAFESFGQAVHAVADGVVVGIASRQRDHRSRETWPSLAFLMTVEAFARELGGARFILGNHLVVDHGDGVYAAYAHLRRGSLRVGVGDRVRAGDHLADVGNSGNSSEPHLHVQLMDRPTVTDAAGVPFRWPAIDIRAGDTDPSRVTKPVPEEPEPGLPADGQVFTAPVPAAADVPPGRAG